jgi:hypothetical protein
MTNGPPLPSVGGCLDADPFRPSRQIVRRCDQGVMSPDRKVRGFLLSSCYRGL